jgi:hypothetical protein
MHKMHGAFIKMHKYYIETVFACSSVGEKKKHRNFQAESNSEYLRFAGAYFVTMPYVI